MKKNGLIDLEELESVIRPETVLVSVMGVNNEIGVIQPLKKISEVRQTKIGSNVHAHCICLFVYLCVYI